MIPNDPVMLLSYVNTQLRDNFSTLDSLCGFLNVNKEEIVDKLKAIDYHYNINENQFK